MNFFSQEDRTLIYDSLDRITKADKDSSSKSPKNIQAYEKQKQILEKFSHNLKGKHGLTHWLGKHDIIFFAKYYMPDTFYCDFGEHHKEMFKYIEKGLKGLS